MTYHEPTVTCSNVTFGVISYTMCGITDPELAGVAVRGVVFAATAADTEPQGAVVLVILVVCNG